MRLHGPLARHFGLPYLRLNPLNLVPKRRPQRRAMRGRVHHQKPAVVVFSWHLLSAWSASAIAVNSLLTRNALRFAPDASSERKMFMVGAVEVFVGAEHP